MQEITKIKEKNISISENGKGSDEIEQEKR